MNKKRKNIIVISGLVIIAFLVYQNQKKDELASIDDLGTYDLT